MLNQAGGCSLDCFHDLRVTDDPGAVRQRRGIGVCRGKREFDKRQSLRERDQKREVERARRQR